MGRLGSMEVFAEIMKTYTGRSVRVFYEESIEYPFVDLREPIVELPSSLQSKEHLFSTLRGRFAHPFISGELAHAAGILRLNAPWWASKDIKTNTPLITLLGFIESVRAYAEQQSLRVVDTGFLAAHIRGTYKHLEDIPKCILLSFLRDTPSLIEELQPPEAVRNLSGVVQAYENQDLPFFASLVKENVFTLPALPFDPQQWCDNANGVAEAESSDEEKEEGAESVDGQDNPEDEKGGSVSPVSPFSQESKEHSEEQSEDLLEELEVLPENKEIKEEKESIHQSKLEEKHQRDNLFKKSSQVSKTVFNQRNKKFRKRPKNSLDNRLLRASIRGFIKAKIRAPKISKYNSSTPPGRLDSRAAVAAAAQESMGIPVTARPFRVTQRKKEESPPPIVGLMCDISGSMQGSVNPMSSLAWALSNAIPRVKGKFAAVTFGSSVKPFVKVGEKLAFPMTFEAYDSREAASNALLALIGHLNLLKSQDVRVIIISSDMIWSDPEIKASSAILKQLKKEGVHIFVVPYHQAMRSWWEGLATPIVSKNLEELPLEITKRISSVLSS